MLVFAEPVHDIQLWTRSKYESPTIALRFRRPVRIPPIRWSTSFDCDIPWRAARSAEGFHLDGLQLRFADPATVRRAFQAAGAEPIVDDLAWWRRWRATRTDPIEGRAIAEAISAGRRSMRGLYALLAVTLVLGVIARATERWPAIAAFAVCAIGLVVYVRWTKRNLTRQVRTAREAADQRGGFRSGP